MWLAEKHTLQADQAELVFRFVVSCWRFGETTTHRKPLLHTTPSLPKIQRSAGTPTVTERCFSIRHLDVAGQTNTNSDSLGESSIDDLFTLTSLSKLERLYAVPNPPRTITQVLLMCRWQMNQNHNSLRDQKRLGQKCGRLCPHVLSRKQICNRVLERSRCRLVRQETKCTIFLLEQLKILTPVFRTPERTSTAMRYTTHHHRQDTAKQTVAVGNVLGRRPSSIELRATLYDNRARQIKAFGSRRYSSHRAKSFA